MSDATPRSLLLVPALLLGSVSPGYGGQPCVGGMVDGFPCQNIELLAHLTESDIGTTHLSDNWGWTDPQTGTEYALLAAIEGTFFVDLADLENPVVLGLLPSGAGNTHVRDVKVFADHAFVVADTPGHGMQIFDLNQLRDVVSPPVVFSPTLTYSGISSAHNLVLNEATGIASPVRDSTCNGGLHMVDVNDPLNPVFVGCFGASVHDAVCVVYQGPDVEHQGQEICIAGNGFGEDVIIGDVTNRAAPITLSTTTYPNADHAHQGWVTEDHRYFLLGDEFDEGAQGVNTTTHVFDIADLDAPVHVGAHVADTGSTDHNLYIEGNFAYQANYRAGFRVLELTDLSSATLTEVAYLDTRPGEDFPGTDGAWTAYPFLDSGAVIVTDEGTGLFIVRPLFDTIFSDGFESGDTSAWSSSPRKTSRGLRIAARRWLRGIHIDPLKGRQGHELTSFDSDRTMRADLKEPWASTPENPLGSSEP